MALPSLAFAPGAATAASAPASQDAPSEPSLQHAVVRVQPVSPTRARIEARFKLLGSEPPRFLITYFPGQRLDDLLVTVDGIAVDAELPGAPAAVVRRLLLPAPAATGLITVTYEVTVPGSFAYRFPLPVPEAPPDAASRVVRLTATVPGASLAASAAFPRFRIVAREAASTTLRADLVAVPAFTHLPYGAAQGVAGELPPGPGFGANFYGFFVLATLWCAAYFAWAVRINRRQRG